MAGAINTSEILVYKYNYNVNKILFQSYPTLNKIFFILF